MVNKTLVALVFCGLIVSVGFFGAYEFGRSVGLKGDSKVLNQAFQDGNETGFNIGYQSGYISGINDGGRQHSANATSLPFVGGG